MTGAATWVLRLILLTPLAALAVAALIDTGPPPESPVRISAFPSALTLFDPLVWTSFGNSLLMAVLVACGSLVIGVPTAQVLARWRFWGRPLLSLLVMGPSVIPPAYLALGVLGLADSFLLQGWPWFTWVWSALVQGVALVVITTAWSLDGLDPDREAAARLAGAGFYRTWCAVTWPLIRPAIALVSGILLVNNLADPGVPLVLGLRRTLGFQVVVDAARPDAFPRIASLGLLLWAFSLAAGQTLRWYGGASPGLAVQALGRRSRQEKRTALAEWLYAAMSPLILALWAVLAWLPVAGLARLGLTREPYLQNPHILARLGILDLIGRLAEAESLRLVVHSVVLGLSVAAVFSILARWQARDSALRLRKGWGHLPLIVAAGLPSLAVGVGILALARVATLGARLSAAGPDRPLTATVLELISRVLDHPGIPGFLLILGVCLAFLPHLLMKRPGQFENECTIARRVDQAVLSGASRAQSRRLGHQGSSLSARTIVLWASLAATSVAPAIVLTLTGEAMPVGPAIVRLSSAPDDSRPRAAALALAAISVNLAALAWAWSGRGRDRGRLEPVNMG